MGTTHINLAALKGKVPREVEETFIAMNAKLDAAHSAIASVRQQITILPTAAQLQQHAARIEQAVATIPAFDATVAGVSTGHKQQASILPVVSGAFAYTSNGTSITWFWDGTNGSFILIVNWPDRSVTQIPPASFQVTGLANSTSYNFFPYFDVVQGGIFFAADPLAGVGTPPIAFAAGASILVPTAIQSQDNHVPLNLSNMAGATTAGGAGGGSGGGRFGGCVSEDTEVVSLHGDMFSHMVPAEEWIEVVCLHGRRLRAVPAHRLFTEQGCVRMAHLTPGMRIVTIDGLEAVSRVERITEKGMRRLVWIPQGNLFWANGLLSHNIK
jgi:hypothetical protein